MGVRARARVARHRPAQVALRAVRRRQGGRARAAASGSPRSTRRLRSRSRRSRAPTVEDVDQAVERRAHGVQARVGRRCPASERAKYLFRIARILQERSREFAVLESLDGGKPIKESRDVDVPLAAAHFWYYAGWADKLEYAFPNRDPRAAGRRGAGHPVELPAADAGLEDRAGPRRGQHRRSQAGQLDAAVSALFFADVCRQADLPPGVVNIITGPGEIGLGPRQASGRRQGRLHRLDGRGQGDRPRHRRARTRR